MLCLTHADYAPKPNYKTGYSFICQTLPLIPHVQIFHSPENKCTYLKPTLTWARPRWLINMTKWQAKMSTFRVPSASVCPLAENHHWIIIRNMAVIILTGASRGKWKLSFGLTFFLVFSPLVSYHVVSVPRNGVYQLQTYNYFVITPFLHAIPNFRLLHLNSCFTDSKAHLRFPLS